ncbi:hypothetical protein BJ684DRAFT_1644, partial [Piptocephalis cylindrospora]
SIAGRGLKLDTAADMEPHLAELAKIEDLREICLSGNTVGVEAAQALGEALKTHTNLETLSLSDIFTGRLLKEIPPSLTAICDAIMDHPNVQTLDLSDNAFGPAGAEPIVPFLSHRRSLRVIRLNNNGLGIRGGKFIAQALTAAAEANKAAGEHSQLRVFIAGRNRLEDGSSQELASAFAAHGLLEEVRMPQNGIRPDGIAHLSQGLSQCSKLRILELQDNTFTDKGSYALAKALPSWPLLETLHIGDCMLGRNGSEAIIRALDESPPKSLHHLNLVYDELEEHAAHMLARVVERSRELELVELNGNCFAEDSPGADAIREALVKIDRTNALGSLSDMEELSEDEDEESEDED